MRKLILDTETTGLDPGKDRIIEVACLEILSDTPTDIKYHSYFNPDGIIISQEAQEIHGLNNSLLNQYKRFDDELDNFLKFIGDAQLIIHNAQFDISMINSALERNDRPKISMDRVLCTLELAKKKFPGSKNNLNALCRRFNISLESREKHGALTDCYLLQRVFIELNGGRQGNLDLSTIDKVSEERFMNSSKDFKKIDIQVSEDEIQNHLKMIQKIPNPIWKKLQ